MISAQAAPKRYAFYAGKARDMDKKAEDAANLDGYEGDLNPTEMEVLTYTETRSVQGIVTDIVQVTRNKDYAPVSFSSESTYTPSQGQSYTLEEGFKETKNGRVYTFTDKFRNVESFRVVDGGYERVS